MCKWGISTSVRVKIPADLSYTGEVRWKDELIDSCIAPLVDALQRGGIDMRGSCCGHGKAVGQISLQDGRTLLIIDGRQWHNQQGRYLFKLLCEWLIWLVRYYTKRARERVRNTQPPLFVVQPEQTEMDLSCT